MIVFVKYNNEPRNLNSTNKETHMHVKLLPLYCI